MYGCLRHVHYRYRLQLPYISHRTCLTNRMGSISHHIKPLVINSLRGGHTHTQTHTHTHTFADRSNSKKPGTRRHAWFKNYLNNSLRTWNYLDARIIARKYYTKLFGYKKLVKYHMELVKYYMDPKIYSIKASKKI